MRCRGGDAAWLLVFDVAVGVYSDLAGISPRRTGLSSGGAAQVGLVPVEMTDDPHRYCVAYTEIDCNAPGRGQEGAHAWTSIRIRTG